MNNEFLELEEEILFEQIFNEDTESDPILEANISVDKINAPTPKKKNKRPRNILITGSGESSHGARMKVSKPGESISRRTSHNDYISIYRYDDDTITYKGNLKDIGMDSSEYKYYEDLFIRNENIIQLVKTGDGKYDQYVDDALIRDEQRRLNGYEINRDKNGNAEIYKGNKLIEKENIRGDKI